MCDTTSRAATLSPNRTSQTHKAEAVGSRGRRGLDLRKIYALLESGQVAVQPHVLELVKVERKKAHEQEGCFDP